MSAILVTGAGGFVCSHCIPVFLSRGYEVIALDTTFDPGLKAEWQARWADRIHLIEGDVGELPDTPVEGLIHGAAVTASPEEASQTPEENFRANIDPFMKVVEWCQQQQVRRAIFMSSSAVYRESGIGPVTETMPAAPYGLYAVAKTTMETLVETLHGLYKRDLVTVRLSNIYGTHEQARPSRPRVSLVGRMIQTALNTGRLSVYRDDPARDWTFASDIGEAMVTLLERPILQHSLYNIASKQRLTPLEIGQAIQNHLPEIEVEINEGNDPAILTVTRLGYLANRRLREETGFDSWTPFSEGIRQGIEYQRQVEVVV